jgi:hypothetical protein
VLQFDNIGKLDVQHDDDDSDNDDDQVSNLHPKWLGVKEAAATRNAISILRVGAPEKMEELAQLSVDNAEYAPPPPPCACASARVADRFSARSKQQVKQQHSTVSRRRLSCPSVAA